MTCFKQAIDKLKAAVKAANVAVSETLGQEGYEQACVTFDEKFKTLQQQTRWPLHPVVEHLLKSYEPQDADLMVIQWPHVSTSDPARLAYSRDAKAVVADRQTVTSVGKYLKRVFPEVPDHILRDAQALFKPDEFKIEEGIENLIKAVELGPRSCMQSFYGSIPFDSDDHEALKEWMEDNSVEVNWCNHPYSVYLPEYGWKIATRIHDGRIDGRCLLLDDGNHKCFVRSYARGTAPNYQSNSDHALEAWLEQQGYESCYEWPQGAKLDLVYHPDGGYLLPYIDGRCDDDRRVSKGQNCFVIDSSGEYLCNNTDGTPEVNERVECECCGGSFDEEDMYHTDDGMVCDHCFSEHYCEARVSNGSRGYYTSTLRREDAAPLYLYHRRFLRGQDSGFVSSDNPPEGYVYMEVYRCFAHLDDTIICTNGELRFPDDPDVVRLAEDCPISGECFALEDDAWEDAYGAWHSDEVDFQEIDGEKYLEDECWQCEATGTWHNAKSEQVVMADGREIHESFFDRVSSDAEWGDADMNEVRQYQVKDSAFLGLLEAVPATRASRSPELAELLMISRTLCSTKE